MRWVSAGALATALAGEAKAVVTGDADLLALETYAGSRFCGRGSFSLDRIGQHEGERSLRSPLAATLASHHLRRDRNQD
jgi:hypothetical protein